MLIGKQTHLNDTLEEVLATLVPGAKRISPDEFLSPQFGVKLETNVVFVNLTDLTTEEPALLEKIKELNSSMIVVGMHTFTVPFMKQQVLDRGFDAYLSFFEFSEQVEDLLYSFGIGAE